VRVSALGFCPQKIYDNEKRLGFHQSYIDDKMLVVAEELDPTPPGRACAVQGPMVGGVRCSLLSRGFAVTQASCETYIDGHGTSLAGLSPQEKLQKQPQGLVESACDPATFQAGMTWPMHRRWPSWPRGTQNAMNVAK
jgi:hypothetical protein